MSNYSKVHNTCSEGYLKRHDKDIDKYLAGTIAENEGNKNFNSCNNDISIIHTLF